MGSRGENGKTLQVARMPSRDDPFVSLIIVNFNGRQHLERLLPSVAALEYPRRRLETLVVDNGPADDSMTCLSWSHPSVRVLRHYHHRTTR